MLAWPRSFNVREIAYWGSVLLVSLLIRTEFCWQEIVSIRDTWDYGWITLGLLTFSVLHALTTSGVIDKNQQRQSNTLCLKLQNFSTKIVFKILFLLLHNIDQKRWIPTSTFITILMVTAENCPQNEEIATVVSLFSRDVAGFAEILWAVFLFHFRSLVSLYSCDRNFSPLVV